MKFKNKKPIRQVLIIEKFLWLPMTIDGETRWLCKSKIEGYYYIGECSGKIRFFEWRFID